MDVILHYSNKRIVKNVLYFLLIIQMFSEILAKASM